jgi:hypothetical protein
LTTVLPADGQDPGIRTGKERLMTRNALGYAARLRQQTAEAHERQTQAMLTPLVESLTHPEEACRRAAVEHILQVCRPPVLGRLVDLLVNRLGRGGVARRGQVVAALVAFGPPVLPALTERFKRGRGPAAQFDVLAALGQMTSKLTGDRIADLLLQVGILGLFAAGGSVKPGIKQTIAQVQRDLRNLLKPVPRARYERLKEAGSPPGAAPDAAAGLPDLTVT